jgi:pimeloyl-ACP methyl ester carboxylesterase
MRILLAAVIGGLITTVPAAGEAQAKPCVTPTTPCIRWVPLGGGAGRSKIYSTFSIDRRNRDVTRAFILIHGTGRNADHYFETAVAAAFLAGALENTVVISPHFVVDADSASLQRDEVRWPNRGVSWRAGGMSTSHPALSAFDLTDEIIRKLADKKRFPKLTKIVVAGHSAGGQFAARYGMASKVHDTPGVTISYVPANPSTYAWPSPLRPLPVGNADPATADKEPLGENGEKVNSNFTFGPFDATKAPNYNQWPAGLERRTGYTEQMTDDQLRKNLLSRPITYLVGQLDVLPLGGFDDSPNAMAQGPTRRARGEALVKFIADSLGGKPKAMVVPECGHHNRCMFTSNEIFPVIFP